MLKSKYRMRAYKRSLYLDGLIYESDTTCYEELHMDRFTFKKLCDIVQVTGRLQATRYITIDGQVAMFIHILAHHLKNRTNKNHFLRSGETVSRYFNRVLKVVMQLQRELLKAPEPVKENSMNSKWKWFKNCLGVLDGTYLEVIVRESDKSRYRNRKGDIATNILGLLFVFLSFMFSFYFYKVDMEFDPSNGRRQGKGGKDRATGNKFEAPGDIIEDLDKEKDGKSDNNTETMNGLDDNQPPTSKRTDGESSKHIQRKRRKSIDGQMLGLRDIAEMMGNHLKESREQMSNMINVIATPDQQNMDNRQKLNEELRKISSLSLREWCKAGSLLVHDKDILDHFFTVKYYGKEVFVRDMLKNQKK
ncbi:hypothetical protein BUALT_Bualt05G0100800 [Buddleja alternifolia]|uniref:DUF8040 domain-containing protein n=1 Tax=Buddleja alternifolia TaxID=168488 RepID=A0AAV6XI75_9LAMI|nr:hypothetical protein BUALT_Bualt05G0100800 [Buddleja alternifolia]